MDDKKCEVQEKFVDAFFFVILGIMLLDVFTVDFYERGLSVCISVALFLYLFFASRIRDVPITTYILVGIVICVNALYVAFS